MADPQGKNRLQEFKYKGKDQDVSNQINPKKIREFVFLLFTKIKTVQKQKL